MATTITLFEIWFLSDFENWTNEYLCSDKNTGAEVLNKLIIDNINQYNICCSMYLTIVFVLVIDWNLTHCDTEDDNKYYII